jgi:hypothetical protein
MSIPNRHFQEQLHPWQLEVLRRFDTGEKRFFDLEWHRKSRKTTLALNLLIRECCRKPNRVYSYVGPEYKQSRAIIWDDPNMLDRYLPDKSEMGWDKNTSTLQVKFANGSLLRILGAGDESQIDSLRGPDNEGVVFDEWQLINPLAWTSVFLPMITGTSLSRDTLGRWAMFLWTPAGLNHATDQQMQRRSLPDWYVETLPASKSHLRTSAQLAEAARNMPPVLYDQEYECAHVSEEESTPITTHLIEGLKGLNRQGVEGKRRIVSIDPDCSINGDECVVYYLENGQVLDEDVFHERDPLKLAGRANTMGLKHECGRYIVDWIGVGTGVCAQLSAWGKDVIQFIASEAPTEPQFKNKRAEAWWYCMRQMMDLSVPYPDGFPSASALRRELPSVRFKSYSGAGKVQLEQKQDTKKRLGHSPDRADCYVQGLWGLKYCPVEMPDDPKDYQREPDRYAVMANSYAVESNL